MRLCYNKRCSIVLYFVVGFHILQGNYKRELLVEILNYVFQVALYKSILKVSPHFRVLVFFIAVPRVCVSVLAT